MILDLFAGPGGWDEGARMLGVGGIIGLEWDEAACLTAEAAGHPRVRGDLSMVRTDAHGRFDGLIASPPCQAWSNAGKGLGKLDKPRILAHVDRIRDAGRWLNYSREGWHDPRSPLVLEPLRYALQGTPEWITCEQVPAVLPLWEAFGSILGAHGYTWTAGILSAEQYGVPQTRKRAVLVARLHGEATLPAPTHQAYAKRNPFDPASPLPRWVSMAEALGWPSDDLALHHVRGTGMIDRHGERPGRNADEPAFALTSKARSWEFRSNQRGTGLDYLTRNADEPAFTITSVSRSAHLHGEKLALEDGAVLQTFRTDYPFSGLRSRQFEQLGNAVPPLLAAAVLGNLLGLDWHPIAHSMRPQTDPIVAEFPWLDAA